LRGERITPVFIYSVTNNNRIKYTEKQWEIKSFHYKKPLPKAGIF